MKKRFLSVLICTLILCTAFAGCQNQSTNTESTNSGEATSNVDISSDSSNTSITAESDTVSGDESHPAENEIKHDPTPRVIDFKRLKFGGFYTDDGLENNVIVRSDEELKAYIDLCQFSEENRLSEFQKNITDGYFKTKSIMFIRCFIGLSDEYETKKLFLNGTDLTVIYSSKLPEIVLDAGYVTVLAYELDRADVIGIETVTVKEESQSWRSSHHTDKLNKIDFSQHFFDGLLKDTENETHGTASAGWLEIIHTQDELDNLLAEYTPHGDKNDFAEFASTLDENYFETKSIIAIPLFFTYANTKFNIEGVYGDAKQIVIATEFDETEIIFDESEAEALPPLVAVIEINKADIPEDAYYTHQFEHIKSN